MFDGPKREVFKRAPKVRQDINWNLYNEEELLSIYDEVQKRLPSLKLSEMNLEKELLIQFHTVRGLQTRVMDDEDIPVNQRAQVANTVASSINKLSELQKEIYSTERFKMIEGLLIRTLTKLPEEVAEKFISDYEEILRNHA